MNKKLFFALFVVGSILPQLASARSWFGGRRHGRDGWNHFFWHRPIAEEAFYQHPSSKRTSHWHPADTLIGMHTKTTKDEYIYTINVPGYDSESIEISTNKEVPDIEISLKSNNEAHSQDNSDNSVSTSFFHETHSMQQSFTVPGDADLDKIKAHLKHGRLTISVKRKGANSREPRRTIRLTQ